MRFALLGTHPDGLAAARALVATGDHELATVLDAAPPDFAPAARSLSDLEEVLADPAIALVIVAGAESVRFEQLRRALQSERHVLCVHPAADQPEPAYQAAIIQADVKTLLLPLLPDALHPVWARLADLAGEVRLLQMEQRSTQEALPLPRWDVLRRIGGEIVELSGYAAAEEWQPTEMLLLHGRFAQRGLLQIALLPALPAERRQFVLIGATCEIELDGPDSRGAARLRWRAGVADWQEETWDGWDRWAAYAQVVAAALTNPSAPDRVTWQDEVRSLELDDAVYRSVEKRRASGLDLAEFSEETGSKGTLTLIGCGMIWLLLLVFGLSIWVPWIRWAIVPLLVGFLGLLALKWLGGRR